MNDLSNYHSNVCLGYNISTGVAEHGVTTMRYIRIENKEQAEAIDRLEFGVSFEVGRGRKGASPLQPHRYLTIQKPGKRARF